MDIKELDNQIVIFVDLPGVKKEHIQLELVGCCLTVSGEKHALKDEMKIHSAERNFGKFIRSLPVPEGITEQDMNATLHDGVLEVRFLKSIQKENESHKKIKVL